MSDGEPLVNEATLDGDGVVDVNLENARGTHTNKVRLLRLGTLTTQHRSI
jgi:hypothetical protein